MVVPGHLGVAGRVRARHRAHQPRGRSAAVRVPTHRRDPPRARVPKAGPWQSCGAHRRPHSQGCYRSADSNRSDSAQSSPSQPTNRTTGPPARLTLSTGGSVPSRRTVISTPLSLTTRMRPASSACRCRCRSPSSGGVTWTPFARTRPRPARTMASLASSPPRNGMVICVHGRRCVAPPGGGRQ